MMITALVSPELWRKQRFALSPKFKGAVFVVLTKRRSEAISPLEFLRLPFSLRGDAGDVIARLALSERKNRKSVDVARQLRLQGAASLAALQGLAGKLRRAQTAVMGRFGRASLRPIHGMLS